MKRSLDELMQIVNEADISDDVKISLMEDITDSFTETDVSEYTDKIDELTKEIEALTEKVADVTARYKARFLEGGAVDQDEPEDKEDIEEYIDIKEI